MKFFPNGISFQRKLLSSFDFHKIWNGKLSEKIPEISVSFEI
jgi:hypothetical protein